MTYPGAEEATPQRVRRYLAENHANADGTPLSDDDLDSLLTKYDDLIHRGATVGSYAYYVGDQIAEATALTAPVDDTDDDES